MTTALRLLCCAFLFAGFSLCVKAQTVFNRPANEESAAQLPPLPPVEFENFTSLVFPAFRPMLRPPLLTPPLAFADGASAALYQAVTKRLGIRYRFFGVDDPVRQADTPGSGCEARRARGAREGGYVP